jgi:hypothetical protein
MLLLALDPGDRLTSWVLYDTRKQSLCGHDTQDNEILIERIRRADFAETPSLLASEMVACYGMPVGKTTFETCLWIGRFVEAFPGPHSLVYRLDVKMHLCHSARAKDANVSQALMDRFGVKGTKKNPGVLYGIRGGEWAALGVALTFAERGTQTTMEGVRV